VNTVASTVVTQVSVKPRNLAIVMKEEVAGIVTCYGTSGTPLGEGAAVRESRAQSNTESRRLLTDMFTDDTDGPAASDRLRENTGAGMMTEAEDEGDEDKDAEGQLAPPSNSNATPAAKTHEDEHTMSTPGGQEGQQVASMLQEAGLAAMLSVSDVLKALEHDPTGVTFTVRAIAWNKLVIGAGQGP
jgi:hypothetical protein